LISSFLGSKPRARIATLSSLASMVPVEWGGGGARGRGRGGGGKGQCVRSRGGWAQRQRAVEKPPIAVWTLVEEQRWPAASLRVRESWSTPKLGVPARVVSPVSRRSQRPFAAGEGARRHPLRAQVRVATSSAGSATADAAGPATRRVGCAHTRAANVVLSPLLGAVFQRTAAVRVEEVEGFTDLLLLLVGQLKLPLLCALGGTLAAVDGRLRMVCEGEKGKSEGNTDFTRLPALARIRGRAQP
jgi:hypothetical protein